MLLQHLEIQIADIGHGNALKCRAVLQKRKIEHIASCIHACIALSHPSGLGKAGQHGAKAGDRGLTHQIVAAQKAHRKRIRTNYSLGFEQSKLGLARGAFRFHRRILENGMGACIKVVKELLV
jgi:hypothetical protein